MSNKLFNSMKLLLLSLFVFLCVFSSNAQRISYQAFVNAEEAPSYVDFSKLWVKPIDVTDKSNLILSTRDTLNDHYLRASAFVTYAVNVQGTNYPLTGTNPIYYFLGEKFPVSSSGYLEGLLVAVSFKVVGTFQDTLAVSIYNSDANTGLPQGGPLGNQIFFLEDIEDDTNSTNLKFSYIKFNNPVRFSGPFVAMMLTRSVRVNNNGLVIFSNRHGDGKNEQRCCIILYTQNGWVSANLGQLIQMEGSPIDIDPMMIPVVNTETSFVNEPIQLSSFTIESIYPDISQNQIKIVLTSKNEISNFDIKIVDYNGRLMAQSKNDNQNSDCFKELNLDISNLNSGTYFCIIQSGVDNIAAKFSIVR